MESIQSTTELLTLPFRAKEIEADYERWKTVETINALEPEFRNLSDEALKAKTGEFKERLKARIGDIKGLSEEKVRQIEDTALAEILPEAYAAVREASRRTLGMAHYDVQLLGGIVMNEGNPEKSQSEKVAEIRTGEGKTVTATLPLYLNALLGKGAHLITATDYLARRDSRWMAPVFHALDMSVGVLQQANSPDEVQIAYVVDYAVNSANENRNNLRAVPRAEAYKAAITYGVISEFGFDYLRDNSTIHASQRVQRGHRYGLFDEFDHLAIDEAKNLLIMSGPAPIGVEGYQRADFAVKQLEPDDYEINKKDNNINFTEKGWAHLESILGFKLWDPDKPEVITPEQVRTIGLLEQSLRANNLFIKDKHYLVQNGQIAIIDEPTGRIMPGRRWNDGLHQAVEAKEGLKVGPESVTYASISLPNYINIYEKKSAMTGTAQTSVEEFDDVFDMEVVPIPTNKEDLRIDEPDIVYRTREGKLRAVVKEIILNYVHGRPILVGTTSIGNTEELSKYLSADYVNTLIKSLLVRDEWFNTKGLTDIQKAVPELEFLNKPIPKLALSYEFDKAVSRTPQSISNTIRILGLKPEDAPRLAFILENGVPHQILNAKPEYQTKEAQIIAESGKFGAVTVATNMAGRGVDIKLGGEIPEDVMATINKVLIETGYRGSHKTTTKNRVEALKRRSKTKLYKKHRAEIEMFIKHSEEEEKVKKLGGLRVIGSERHEARRIDNQLRGRGARQGDPGSTRFYLSLEDDLIITAYGGPINNTFTRRVDGSFSIENKAVAGMIANTQLQIEGKNLDLRKHIRKYDDVLNAQRAVINRERINIELKTDFMDYFESMVENELDVRASQEEIRTGELRNLAIWLDNIQLSDAKYGELVTTYTNKLLIERLNVPDAKLGEALHNLAKAAFEADPNQTDPEVLEIIYNDIDKELNLLRDSVTFRNQNSFTDRDKLNLIRNLAYVQIPVPITESNKTRTTLWNHRRLDFSYMLGHILGNVPWKEQKENIEDYLSEVLKSKITAWGEREFSRKSELNISDDDPDPVGTIGKTRVDEQTKQILQNTINQQWIEYQILIEGFRTSVQLEAYGQRDPLTIFKIKTAEMFDELLSSIRNEAIWTIFHTFPPAVHYPLPKPRIKSNPVPTRTK